MNYFSYEFMSKEKVNNVLEEGTRSQATYRDSATRRFRLNLPKLSLLILGIVGALMLVLR